MKRIVIYTSIFGKMDDLLEPEVIPNNCDFVCFTDSNFTSDIWQIRKVVPFYDAPVRDSRRYKTKPHIYLSEYEISIWIDGTFIIKKDVNELVDKYLQDANMACFSHNNTALDPHDCIYFSANYILSLGQKNALKDPEKGIQAYKDDPKLIISQMEKYKSEGYPENNGLVISGILLRKHNEPDVITIMEDWWTEIKNHSHICQLSLPYVFWKNNFHFNWIDGDIRNNEYILHQGKHTIKTVSKKYGQVSEYQFLNMQLNGKKIRDVIKDKFDGKTFGNLSDVEIKRLLMLNPDRNWIPEMIGRMIEDKPYISFYMNKDQFPIFSMEIDIPKEHFSICGPGILEVTGMRGQKPYIPIIITSEYRNHSINNEDIRIMEPNVLGNKFGSHGDDDIIHNYSFQINGYNFVEPRFYFTEDQLTNIQFFTEKGYKGYPFNKISPKQWGI